MLALVLKRLAIGIASALASVIVPAAAFPIMAVDPAPPPLNPPLVGFSFSPAAVPLDLDPVQALTTLLTTLQPDLVRLPIRPVDGRSICFARLTSCMRWS